MKNIKFTLITKIIALSLSISTKLLIQHRNKRILTRKKYLVLIFSDNNGKPSKEFTPCGYGGFRHNEIGYLQKLPRIAKSLNRTAVFPPPWISLEKKNNNNKPINKNHSWSTYLSIDNIDNLEKNPPFSFSNNGDIVTDLSVTYYPSNTPLDKMDNKVDIIALVNYNDIISGLKSYSYLSIKYHKNYHKIKKILFNNPPIKYSTSNLLKSYANTIISKLNLEKFTFIHIRRGDFLDNHILAPPKGIRPYTSSDFVSNFIKSRITNKNIIVATNEKNSEYKKTLVELLDDYNVIFEEEYFKYLPDNILNDNYCIYLISHEIARKAETNIGTHGYVRLGNKYDYRLSDFNTDKKKVLQATYIIGNFVKYLFFKHI